MNLSVSVIIPVYNAERYITECLESVVAQTYRPYELIIIDDGSTDQSLAVIQSFIRLNRLPAVTLLTRENRGVSHTLNEAIDQASGDLVAFLDADDCWLPDKLARQVPYLQAHPDTDACFGYVQPFISPDLPIDVQATIACSDSPLPGWLKQTMLIRRKKFSETGFFDPNYHTGDFIDWFIRAKEAGLRYGMLPAVVTRRRLHRSGLASQTQYHKEFAHILKATLDRRATR